MTKRKMLTKTVSTFLIITALLTFTACGQQTQGNNIVNAPNTGGQQSVPEEDKVDTFTLMLATDPTLGDWNKMWCLDIIEEKTNVRFEVNAVSKEGWEEKKNLAFATGNYPDCFLNDLKDIDLATYGGQGIILALEDYMTPEIMPNFYAVMNDGYENLKASMTFPDGHIYSFKGLSGAEREYALSRFWVNKAWAETLGVKIPETLDEFYTYLKAVKDGDPNGNGDTTDEIPLGGKYDPQGDPYYDAFIPVLTGFGLSERRYEAIDGKVQYNPTVPVYKEFLKYMNKLYSEELIDQEYFSQTDDLRKAKQAQGLVACFTDHAAWLNIPDEDIWRQNGSIEPMTSEFNSKKIWPSKDAILYGALAITNKVNDPAKVEKLMKFCDWCYSEEGTTALWRGPEIGSLADQPDYGWYFEEVDGANLRKYAFPEDKYESHSKWIAAEIKPGNNFWPYAGTAKRADDTSKTTSSWHLTENIVTYNLPYYHIGWPVTIRLTPEESEELSLISTDLEAYVEQMEAQMIIGEIDIETGFDTMVKGCQDRNLSRYLQILQTAYDRYVDAL